MKTLALAVTAFFVLLVPISRAQAQTNADVSIDFFYDALQPYGDWIYIDNYGYCWEPYPELVGLGWQPYTDGYWAYTDGGWTWMTEEPFGWATYHYGRWMINAGRWCWVPGYDWAPAWVSWRQSPQYIGWAPLPPEAYWQPSIGFSTWTDSYYDIGPGYYNFVPYQSFACRTSLRPYVLNRSYNVGFIDQSVNITNISYNNRVVNNIFVGGPDVNRLDRMGGNRVQRYDLRRDDAGLRNDWLRRDGDRDPRHLSRVEHGQLIVASPHIRHDAQPGLPSRVRESFVQPQIDHGWKQAGNSEQGNHLRSQREEAARDLPKNLPTRQPMIATSTTPPPAVGRTLSNAERHSSGSSPSGADRTEEVRRATPMDTADRTPFVRPGSALSDSSSRFGRPDALPLPGTQGNQRPDFSERGSSAARSAAAAEVRPAMPGSTFRKSEEVRPATPSPFGFGSRFPQTSRSAPPTSATRPTMPSRSSEPSQRPSFTPQVREQQQRPTFTPQPQQQRPSFTPQPQQQRPSFTPQPQQQRPTFTPQPQQQRPSFTPQPQQQRPSFTPQPQQQRPSFTPQPQQQRPSFTPQPQQQRPSFTPQPQQQRPSFTPQPQQQRPSFTPQLQQQRSSTTPQPQQPGAPSGSPSAGEHHGHRR